MKKGINKYWFCLVFLLYCLSGNAEDLVAHVYDAELPVLINKIDNLVCEVMIESELGGEVLNELTFIQEGILPVAGMNGCVYYSGTSSAMNSRTPSQAIRNGVMTYGGSQSYYCHPAYSIKKCEQSLSTENVFPVRTKLVRGQNYFWVSLRLVSQTSLNTSFSISVKRVKVNGKEISVRDVKKKTITHYVGIAVRQAGDDNVHSYRIPGLVTTNNGTLLGVYDVRHQTNIDLQEDIDIGMSRSTDGGQSWEPMKIIMDMGEYNGLPQGQNGIGDPAILVDERSNTIWTSAVWVHGLANARAWRNVKPGMTPEDGTGQLILVKSTDDGKTWSSPINITSQVKSKDMTMLLQGPGRGITTHDGTLVFPVQYKSVNRQLRGEIAIIYSKDGGKSWHRSNAVSTEELVSEPQIAEVIPGTLMINARTSAPCRFVAVSTDLGMNWRKHSSSGCELIEPGCMGSLLHIKADRNILGKNILLFSNPNTPAMSPSMSGRKNLTIKASLDAGITWPLEYQINLDEEQGWGYSCLTQIDKETVGILYEGSTAQMVFQKIRLKDLIRNNL